MPEQPERIGRYRVQRLIGRGSTAAVYLAENPETREPVAIKYVRRCDQAQDQARWWRRVTKLFRAEGAVGQRLSHANLISIYETVVEADRAYVVMEYFPGRSLDAYCRADNMLAFERVAQIGVKCALALDHAYRHGVVHRDIKPANILINDYGDVRLTDFGLALNIIPAEQTESTFIMGVGSPAYMSPEQIKHYPLNQKTDLYSLGVVLFHLLTGRLPFRGDNPAQLIYRIVNTDPPRASLLNPYLPQAVDAVLERALQKDLYSRYRNGAELAQELAIACRAVQSTGEKAQPPEDRQRFLRLRSVSILRALDDVQLWELLRIVVWRTVPAGDVFCREGDDSRLFGIVLSGHMEQCIEGELVGDVGPGALFGELSWLGGGQAGQVCTTRASTPVCYIEINPAALELASEALQYRLRECVTAAVVDRMRAALRVFAKERQLAAPPFPAGQSSR